MNEKGSVVGNIILAAIVILVCIIAYQIATSVSTTVTESADTEAKIIFRSSSTLVYEVEYGSRVYLVSNRGGMLWVE